MKVFPVRFAAGIAASMLSFALLWSASVSAAGTGDSAAAQGLKALQGGHYAEAVELYESAIGSAQLAPESLANAFLNKALAEQYLGQNDGAIRDYTAALELDAMAPKLRATALYNRGLSHNKLRQLPLSIEDYTAALVLDPELSHAYYSRGNALRESGQLLFALSDFERAIRYGHPDPARVHYATALAYESLRRPQEAKQALEQAVAINPNHSEARRKLGAIRAATGQPGADPLITGSVSGIVETVLHKPPLPSAVAPTPVLLNAPSPAAPSAVASLIAKLQDRLPEEVLQAEVAAVNAGPETPAQPEDVQTRTDTVAPAVEPEVVVATLQTPTPEPAVALETAGWSVQLASASSEDGAWSTWAKMQKRYKVLRDVTPVVVQADLGTKGIFYRIRLTGFGDQVSAKKSCSSFKKSGVACFVSKSGG